MVLEDVGDGLVGRVLDFLVGIDEGKLETGGEPASDGRFAAARHADENDRARAEVSANAADSFGVRLLGFASYAELDHLCLMAPSLRGGRACVRGSRFPSAFKLVGSDRPVHGHRACRLPTARHNGVTLSPTIQPKELLGKCPVSSGLSWLLE